LLDLVFDIETDGFLENVSKVHCLNAIDRRTGREYRFTDHEFYQDVHGNYTKERTPRAGTIDDALALMAKECDVVEGLNIIEYDLPALRKVKGFVLPRHIKRRDQKNISRLIYSTLKDTDFAAVRKGRLPQSFVEEGLIGLHSLRAWGIRLGKNMKAEFKPEDYGHTWATIPFIKEMDDYCMQDVRTNVDICAHFDSKQYSEEAIEIECRVAEIIQRQVQYGVLFDVEAAQRLVAKLQIRKLELEQKLRDTFQPWFRREGADVTPKRSQRRTVEATGPYGEDWSWKAEYVAGAPYTKVKLIDFNPASRDHIADRMTKLFGWEPTEYTAKGRPQVDEETLGSLTFPEAKLCVEYLTVDKRLGQLAEGKEAWLKAVGPDGRIHGQVNTMGAVTGRMSHYRPNLGQVPRVSSPYGPECRALFIVPKGKKLVGCDAEGLELREQGHYQARFDDGEFVRITLDGRKEDGTDMHSRSQKALKFNSRDNTKTFWYAQSYGAQGYMLGTVVLADMTPDRRDRFYDKYPPGKKRKSAIGKLGNDAKVRLVSGFKGLEDLITSVQKAAQRGYLVSHDGRKIHIRSPHAALNTLLQGGGAVVMKKAQVMLDDTLQDSGLVPGIDYEFVLTVHDEWQLEVEERHAEFVGREAAAAIRRAGEFFKLRCPLAGSYQVGDNWRDTH
jgi:DNA polymerase-1